MKWQDVSNAAVVASQRITQQAAITGAPRTQVELVTPLGPPGRGIVFAGTHVIGRS